VDEWPVELFVHTTTSLSDWYERDRARLRNTLADMVATGLPLVGGDVVDTLKAEAESVIVSGPPPLNETDWQDRRYFLTDAVDDLAGALDRDERDAIAGQVLVQSAEFSLLTHNQWLGGGKWLIRRLRQMDADLSNRLSTAHRRCIANGEPAELIAFAEEVLQPAGGRLMEGYRRS
ncbi:MAG: nucleotidyltransferase domain-containing protein, partial [Candidatus Nanopelagicales bacterium]